jgi:hypothetical protein
MKQFFGLIGLAFLFTCTLTDNNNTEFGFVRINNAILVDNIFKPLPSKIKDIWLYADDQFLGVFPIPSSIPIPITNKQVKLSIRGGIKPNGQNESSEEYPFFTVMDTIVTLNGNESISILPRFKYKAECKFDIIEDFEISSIFSVVIGAPNLISCLMKKEGSGVNNSSGGLIGLSNTVTSCETTHFNSFSNQNNAFGKVYLELDYKNNEKFFIGTILNTRNQLVKSYDIVIVESENWNRIYIDLTNKISRQEVQSYQIAISALLDQTRRTEAKISFDNIRLIHF